MTAVIKRVILASGHQERQDYTVSSSLKGNAPKIGTRHIFDYEIPLGTRRGDFSFHQKSCYTYFFFIYI